MKHSIRTAVVMSAIALGIAAAGTAMAGADSTPTIRGTVERLPASADLVGEWTVNGQTLTVDRETRLERGSTATTGYWTQAATGVVLRAPGWGGRAAEEAGFRPATSEELTTFRPGRVVKAHVAPRPSGLLYVTKVELDHARR